MSRTKLDDEDMRLLRQRLDQIDGFTAEDTTLHRERVEELRSEYGFSIRYIDDGETARSDCMQYALNIPNNLVAIAAIFPCILDRFSMTLPQVLAEIPAREVNKRHIVLYLENGRTKHLGRVVQGTRVVSKWGRNPTYEHDLCEVPASYGDEFEFFEQPAERYITIKFIEFVRHHCRYIDIKESFEEIVSELGL
jgi:hypothetical protein